MPSPLTVNPEIIKDIFGARQVVIEDSQVVVDGRRYPVIDGVIIALPPEKYTVAVKQKLRLGAIAKTRRSELFAEDIQYSFGHEWQSYQEPLPEYAKEFKAYFDLVPLERLKTKKVCDLGCGSGRWSAFLKGKCRALILVDFSDAIFIARHNLGSDENILYVMADILDLPFRPGAFDFLFSIGVLHHLPSDCLQAVRRLKNFAAELLIYLYYALDNRPWYFRRLLSLVTFWRQRLSKIRSENFRNAFSFLGAIIFYYPCIGLGRVLQIWRLGDRVPLYKFYHHKSLTRIRQDVYDRFFTSIEQRVSRNQIMSLRDTFAEVIISEQEPYWHFVCSSLPTATSPPSF
ncbi:MAG: class I SAM-dependent methyltransferase [Candidatus Magasanikbacteria bacterium]|nr:class I SAM-dependent methyltransferase [Candidatus Magasanikbacteria bacterium]